MADSEGEASDTPGQTLWKPARQADPQEGNDDQGRSWLRILPNLRLRIQRLLRFGLIRVSAPIRKLSKDDYPHARARLERVRFTERYFYLQEISQNAARRQTKTPEGRIELVLPYDGNRFFNRQAVSDVEHAHQLGADPGADALIGHLVITGFEHAKLGDLLDQGPTHGSVPIRVPVAGLPGPAEPEPLTADRTECVLSHRYEPETEHLKVFPVDVDAKLDDPDDAQLSHSSADSDFEKRRLRIMRQVGFRPELWLNMSVRLDIPRELATGAKARVSEVFVSWPTHTSLRSLELHVDEELHTLRYNPKREGLEWSNIEMALEDDPGGGAIRTLRSPEMILVIPQPGELYQQASLDGQVRVTVNRLLSGMDARLFDATGSLCRRPRVSRQSRISTKFTLILDDAFSRRMLSPHQQLHFDEVIPAETRIDDIKMALKNLGFTVADQPPLGGPESRWLRAERTEGPDVLTLLLYVEGKQYKSRRQRRVPGGMTYRTDLDSGELRIYVYGWLARDSRPIVREMNALRETLRERFDRLPARR